MPGIQEGRATSKAQGCLYGNLCLVAETSLRSAVTSGKPYRAGQSRWCDRTRRDSLQSSQPLCLFEVEQRPAAPQYPSHTQYTRNANPEIGKCLETCLQVPEWPSDGRAGTRVHNGAWGLVNAPW
ncbi:hypothetical protein FVEG_14763 [Fusarium verticillioides 7600]|uniref:Uncharacterized protein n=1 Tax=Gibberella moniliformis (strain M3125 / FGSC 7600) TaxID=334819 RepID=W7LD84_GIBM7|nr:hypothetical protein FVEG_14763 [Fusarium verticillioides 7600]EWG37403.1 hypothetical protein FVEG_14763 [Fusarium verticillioides 7600]